jgi:hypothetical protein
MANGNQGPSGGGDDCNSDALKQAIAILENTSKLTQDADVQKVLNDCVRLIKDVCEMNMGFGAALMSKARSA